MVGNIVEGAKSVKYTGRLHEISEWAVTLENGNTKMFERVVRPPGVRVVLENAELQIMLMKEYRYETHEFDWRLPGGKVRNSFDDYKNGIVSCEDILGFLYKAVINECREEVGVEIKPETISLLEKSICGATIEWDLWYFLVKESSFIIKPPCLEPGELIVEHQWFSYEEVMKLMIMGSVAEGRTVAVLSKYLVPKLYLA